MSADLLRRAAALMRERAERAEASGDGEPWFPADELHGLIGAGSRNTADAEHIASWHPAVALAVADWLESTANDVEHVHTPVYNLTSTTVARALAVARAYLGSDA